MSLAAGRMVNVTGKLKMLPCKSECVTHFIMLYLVMVTYRNAAAPKHFCLLHFPD